MIDLILISISPFNLESHCGVAINFFFCLLDPVAMIAYGWVWFVFEVFSVRFPALNYLDPFFVAQAYISSFSCFSLPTIFLYLCLFYCFLCIIAWACFFKWIF